MIRPRPKTRDRRGSSAHRRRPHPGAGALPVVLLLLVVGCGGDGDGAPGEPRASAGDEKTSSGDRGSSAGGDRRGGPPGRGGGFPGIGSGPADATDLPIEITRVVRRSVADYIDTNGVLEAENEVDLIARASGPIVALEAEEGQLVEAGQLLARIDPDPLVTQLELAKVELEESRIAFERARRSFDAQIISEEAFDQARSRLDASQARARAAEIDLSYTDIRAPFRGLVIERVIKFAEFVSPGDRLFRISDFDPLLCEIQIPEKDLPRVRLRQEAYLTVEPYPDERFAASVLRISPVIDAGTGTVRVTLQVRGRGKLRPGMFATVFLEIERRPDALVIPKRALVLESIGDTVYVFEDGVARRREVSLGFSEIDVIEVTDGLAEGEQVIVVGQDAVSDGTPVYVLGESPMPGSPAEESAARGDGQERTDADGTGSPQRPGGAGTRPGGPPPGFDPSNLDEATLDRIRERMRSRGLSEEQIEERIEAMKRGESPFGRPGGSGHPETEGRRPPG